MSRIGLLKDGTVEGDSTTNFESFIFPGGEPHFKINHISTYVQIVCYMTHDNIIKLLILTDAIRRYWVGKQGNPIIELYIPYFPGARQDRVNTKGEPLTVKIYADLINSQNYDQVTILDPHSDTTLALVNNSDIDKDKVAGFVNKTIYDHNIDTVLIPDAGAIKKIDTYLYGDNNGFFQPDVDIIQCLKHRDVKTGELSGFQVLGNLQGKRCLIVDDICDGGGTFLGLAKEARKTNPEWLGLYITHGIFSKGVVCLENNFNHIFTTNSIEPSCRPKLTVYRINDNKKANVYINDGKNI